MPVNCAVDIQLSHNQQVNTRCRRGLPDVDGRHRIDPFGCFGKSWFAGGCHPWNRFAMQAVTEPLTALARLAVCAAL